MSPMKWILLNLITQSSIMQMISFLSFNTPMNYNNKSYSYIMNMKMTWKW